MLEQSGAVGIALVPEFRSPMAEYLEEVRPKLPDLREVILFTECGQLRALGESHRQTA